MEPTRLTGVFGEIAVWVALTVLFSPGPAVADGVRFIDRSLTANLSLVRNLATETPSNLSRPDLLDAARDGLSCLRSLPGAKSPQEASLILPQTHDYFILYLTRSGWLGDELVDR